MPTAVAVDRTRNNRQLAPNRTNSHQWRSLWSIKNCREPPAFGRHETAAPHAGEERKGLACRLAVAPTPERWELVPANYLPVIPLGIFLGYDGVHPL
jgi:hypothetical protein